MLPLRHSVRWRIGSALLLLITILAAIAPEYLWPNVQIAPVGLQDKLLHAAAFAVLTVWFCGQYQRRSYWRIVIALLAFGGLIELFQSMLSYRSSEFSDLTADCIGIAAGLLAAYAGLGGWSLRLENRLAGINE